MQSRTMAPERRAWARMLALLAQGWLWPREADELRRLSRAFRYPVEFYGPVHILDEPPFEFLPQEGQDND